MTDTQPFMDEAQRLARDTEAMPSGGNINLIATALSSAYQRGREDAAFWQKARMRAVFIQMVDKLPEEAVTALTDAMNAVSDEMESATAIRTERDKG